MNDNIDWKDVAHYGSAVACLAMAGLTELGVTLPGVTVDPKVAGAAGIGILAAGLKGPAAKAAILLPLLAVLSSPVQAADVPTKARPNVFAGYAAGSCGMFLGLNTMGGAGSLTGTTVPGASVIQGDIGGTIGYGCPIGTTAGSFWFLQGNFDIANMNGSANGLSLTGPAHFEQQLAIGGPLSSMLNLFPSISGGLSVPSLPALPGGVTTGPQYPFLFASLHEQDVSAQLPAALAQGREWLISPGLGIGLESRLSNGVVADVSAQWILQSNGLALGPEKVGFGNAGLVELVLKY